MKKAPLFNHKVLEIDERVKTLISLYIGLFENQREAAQKIGVSACTINTYNTRSTNIALYVFDKIHKELSKRFSEEELEKHIGGSAIQEIRSKSRKQNGAQIDHVMYVISPGIRTILDLFVEPYPSREAAGADLGLNPRTFTAYFKGQISSFPRTSFWQIIDKLIERGLPEENLLKAVKAADWEEILETRQRSRTLNVTKKELQEELIKAFERGSLREKDISRSVANASERLYGNLGAAIRHTMKEIERRTAAEVEEHVYQNDYVAAVETLNRFERHLCLYREKENQINKSLPKHKKQNTHRLLRGYLRTSQELEDKVNDFVEGRAMTLFKRELATGLPVGPDVASEETPLSQFQLIKKYSLNQKFAKGDYIEHPGLGVGEIVQLKGPNRMVVRFINKKHGLKELVMGARATY